MNRALVGIGVGVSATFAVILMWIRNDKEAQRIARLWVSDTDDRVAPHAG